MDLNGAKASNGPGWAWTRTAAVVLFVLTGILLVASLSQAKSFNGMSFNGLSSGIESASAAAVARPTPPTTLN
jgi:hypothetical protein